jgi:hypothetical protein
MVASNPGLKACFDKENDMYSEGRGRAATAFDDIQLREEPPLPEKPGEVRPSDDCQATAVGCGTGQSQMTACFGCRPPTETEKPPPREGY